MRYHVIGDGKLTNRFATGEKKKEKHDKAKLSENIYPWLDASHLLDAVHEQYGSCKATHFLKDNDGAGVKMALRHFNIFCRLRLAYSRKIPDERSVQKTIDNDSLYIHEYSPAIVLHVTPLKRYGLNFIPRYDNKFLLIINVRLRVVISVHLQVNDRLPTCKHLDVLNNYRLNSASLTLVYRLNHPSVV